ncbi:MAG: major capsid protein [Microviridae sp.]|nr:MAG: major capsid protein [Microviridae sp.]
MKLIRHNHDLSFTHTTSFDAGKLVPVAHVEILPGDTINMKTSAFLRVEPLNKPLMHEVEMRIHHWFVPNRIMWDLWEDFITGVSVPTSPATRPPLYRSTNVNNYEIIDHCGGSPVANAAYDAWPVLAYNRIWDEFYRDQEVQIPLDATQLSAGTLRNIAWNKDYFTTARKLPQQGVSTTIPFEGEGGLFPVKGIGWTTNPESALPTNNPALVANFGDTANRTGHSAYVYSDFTSITSGPRLQFESKSAGPTAKEPSIYADATASSNLGISIDALRQAMATQRIHEARALFGERYTDYLKYYGVNSSDARLQRPEYLGGFTKRVHFSEVLSTGDTTTGAQLGHGIAHKTGGRFRKMFEEHGTLMSLMSVRPLATYQQGRPKKFNRPTPLDHWTREFENTPWQAITLSELYSTAANSDDPNRTSTTFTGDPTFGYTSRFDEYRESPNIVTGALRRSDDAVVDSDQTNYTWGRFFGTNGTTVPTTVDGTFITCDPSNEVFQGTKSDHFIVHLNHSIKAKRLVSTNARIMHAL